MKLQSNEFEPSWFLTAKFHPNRSTGSGCTGKDTGQKDKQTDKPVGDLVRAPPLSNFRALPFRDKGLNQNSVDTVYAGNLGFDCTKISEY